MSSRKYAQDYDLVVTTDEKGRERRKAVYRGIYYEVNLDQADLLKFRRFNLLLAALLILLLIGSGFVGNKGMNNFYVALPFGFSLFPLVYLVDAALHLPKEKRLLRRDEVSLSFDRIKVTSILLGIFISVGIIGEIVFLIWFAQQEDFGREYLYLFLLTASALAVFVMLRWHKRIKITTGNDSQ